MAFGNNKELMWLKQIVISIKKLKLNWNELIKLWGGVLLRPIIVNVKESK